jgi:hypothetical protein
LPAKHPKVHWGELGVSVTKNLLPKMDYGNTRLCYTVTM